MAVKIFSHFEEILLMDSPTGLLLPEGSAKPSTSSSISEQNMATTSMSLLPDFLKATPRLPRMRTL
jgi:hypothetical protein